MEEIAKQITTNVSYEVEILAAVIIGVAVIKTLLNPDLSLENQVEKSYGIFNSSDEVNNPSNHFRLFMAIAIFNIL